MKNIDILKEVVGTQYNDMMGLISIDSKTGGEIFWNLLKNHGIYNPQNHPSTFSKRSVSILRFFSKTKRLF